MSRRGTGDAIKRFFSEVFKRHTEDDAEQVVIVGAIGTIPDPETLTSECPRPWLYTRVFAFFLLTTMLLFIANVLTNPGQFSNVLVVGAFAVPFTVLVLFFEFNVFRNISFYTVLKALFIGGALSLITTAVLPSFWFQGISSVSDAFVAGIGEEIAKMLVVYWILKRNRAYPYILNGLLVGAAVGAGFSIFETAGYGMMFLLGGDNAWIGKESIFVLGVRNLLAPGGHVVWAAISGAGLLFAARRETLSARMLRRKAFLAAFLISVVLHILWDVPFFESGWWGVGLLLILTLIAWFVVAWFLRRGLEEVNTLRAVVPYQREEFVPLAIAGPWRRWVARMFDLTCGGIVVCVVLCRICAYFGFLEGLYKVNEMIYAVAVLPLLLLFEAVIYELFGTTFGKWLFSLRVCDNDNRDVSSKTYLVRLVRLWFSGLGLVIPVVSLITSVIQYRRLSSRSQTSYDKALGLRVIKGRFHPLRWLVVLPVLLAVGLIVMAAMSAEDNSAEKDRPSNKVDARIERAISSSGLTYTMADNGVFIVKFRLGEEPERMQTCLVYPDAVVASGSENMLICSIVAGYDSLQDTVLDETLSENVTRGERLWCKIENRLALRVLLPFDVSPRVFCGIMKELAEDADAAEKQLTGKDEY